MLVAILAMNVIMTFAMGILAHVSRSERALHKKDREVLLDTIKQLETQSYKRLREEFVAHEAMAQTAYDTLEQKYSDAVEAADEEKAARTALEEQLTTSKAVSTTLLRASAARHLQATTTSEAATVEFANTLAQSPVQFESFARGKPVRFLNDVMRSLIESGRYGPNVTMASDDEICGDLESISINGLCFESVPDAGPDESARELQ